MAGSIALGSAAAVHRAVVVSAAIIALCAHAGCSSSGDSPLATSEAACSGSSEQRLIGASNTESYLGLADAQIRSIVQVIDSTRPSTGALCSGVFIAPGWVVTAAHCLEIESPELLVGGSAGLPDSSYSILRSIAHPDRDVALLDVGPSLQDASSSAAPDLRPIAANAPGRAPPAIGESAELAGFGLTEEGDTRERRFLIETVTAVDDGTMTVEGFGASGACNGDSGGPLLLRDPAGSVVVAGVLSAGSLNCVGKDEFERLDTIQDWLVLTMGAAPSDDAECGTISPEGRCLYGSAMWCSGSALKAESCTGSQHCGWDPASAGFRCVDASTDPCDGVDSVGACVSNAALRCNRGALVRAECGCDACRVDGETGAPHCVPSP